MAWNELCTHCHEQSSDLVLLPEMPFSPWVAACLPAREDHWRAAVEEHDRWMSRLGELGAEVVVGTRPVGQAGSRRNEVFVKQDDSIRSVHQKVYLPNEEGFWEASWYGPGEARFQPFGVGALSAGTLVCTEIWFGERARHLGQDGIHLLLAPRATAGYSAEKWLAGGRVAAVMSGAFCLSSNRGGTDRHGTDWAGQGWVLHPEEGEVLGLTHDEQPFVTIEIDPDDALRAKTTYPRYVRG